MTEPKTPEGLSKLKPCPFCGSKADSAYWLGPRGEMNMVVCSNDYCGVHPYIDRDGRDTAIGPWNTRAPTKDEAQS